MEFIEQIINTTIQSFDFGFCIAVNVLTYIIVKCFDDLNAGKKTSTWRKRLVMLFSVLSIGTIYYFTGSDIKLIINSSILAPVFWSWIGKPIVDKLGFGYSKEEN